MIMDGYVCLTRWIFCRGILGRRSETDKIGSKFGAVDLFLRRTGIKTSACGYDNRNRAVWT